jgi:hypothetical protein
VTDYVKGPTDKRAMNFYSSARCFRKEKVVKGAIKIQQQGRELSWKAMLTQEKGGQEKEGFKEHHRPCQKL